MASQTITGPDIQYTQDNKRCYAFSAQFTALPSWITLLDFESPSGYILGEVQFQGLVNYSASTPSDGYTSLFRTQFNDEIIALNKTETHLEDSPSVVNLPLLIPPHTRVAISRLDEGEATTRQGGCVFVGRVYEYLPVRN